MSYQVAWNPPRGSVTIADERPNGYLVVCPVCTFTYRASFISDARDQKSWHRCPVGTPGAYPTCPECGSFGQHCRGTKFWHEPRVALFDAASSHHGVVVES